MDKNVRPYAPDFSVDESKTKIGYEIPFTRIFYTYEKPRTSIDIANEIAPEHLELCVDNPFEYLGYVKNAGSVFLGKNCPEALGDYFAGPNHTLPTSGTARFSSPLSDLYFLV